MNIILSLDEVLLHLRRLSIFRLHDVFSCYSGLSTLQKTKLKRNELKVTSAVFKHRKVKSLVNSLTTGCRMNYTDLKFKFYLALCLLLTASLNNTEGKVQKL